MLLRGTLSSFACAAAFCALLLGVALTSAGEDWGMWDFPSIMATATKQYGDISEARPRIEAWQLLLEKSADLPESEKLKVVNRFFNEQMLFESDEQVWHQEDYWATPMEALIKGAGDCEDFALAKYFSLRELGVSSDKLRITYVKALSLNQAHMVLTWYATPTAEPLVLDNLIDDIRPASKRTDLLPVYSFNAEGVFLPGAQKRSGDAKNLSRWQDVLKKMHAEGFAIGAG